MSGRLGVTRHGGERGRAMLMPLSCGCSCCCCCCVHTVSSLAASIVSGVVEGRKVAELSDEWSEAFGRLKLVYWGLVTLCTLVLSLAWASGRDLGLALLIAMMALPFFQLVAGVMALMMVPLLIRTEAMRGPMLKALGRMVLWGIAGTVGGIALMGTLGALLAIIGR